MNSIYIDFSREINDLSFIFDFETLTQISINIDSETHIENMNSRLFFQRMQSSVHIRHVIINIDQCKIERFDVIHKFLNQYIETIEINYLHGYNFKDSNFFTLIEAIQSYPNITTFNLNCIHNYFSFRSEKFIIGPLCPVHDVVVNKNNLYDFFQEYDPNFNHDRCMNIINAINSLYTRVSLTRCRIRQHVLKNCVSMLDVRSFFDDSIMDNLCDILSHTNLINFSIKLCIHKKNQCRIYDLFSEHQQYRIDNRVHVKSARNT